MSTSSTSEPPEEQPAPAVPLSNLNRARTLLRSLGKRPLKGFGQHFLVDNSVLGKIIEAGQVGNEDTVVEVGPGLGILTQELARKAARVIAVELDRGLIRFLQETLAPYSNVSIVQADILKTDPEVLLQAGPYKVIANLPYNIASPVIRKFLQARLKPRLLVVMVQREVARRMVAEPGDMSPLSVGVQLYGRPRIVHQISPGSFFPPPKIHSAIVRIDVYDRPAVDVPEVDLFRAVHAGFGQARKKLRNSLAAGLQLSVPDTLAMLARAGVGPERRAETLSLPEWGKIALALAEARPSPDDDPPALIE